MPTSIGGAGAGRPFPTIALVLLLSGTAQIGASAQNTGATLTASDWRADLRELVAHVEENHREPFHSVTEADFRSAVDSLDQRLATLSPAAITREFARLLAMIGDGHTRLSLPIDPHNLGYQQGHTPDPHPASGVARFPTLPVRFREFEEGVHIASATPDFVHLLGARLLSIGGLSPDEAISALAPYVAHDTPAGMRFHAIVLLAVPGLLTDTESDSSAPFILVVRTADGREHQLDLPLIGYGEMADWADPGPLRASQPDDPYFSLETDRPGTVVVRIHQINDSPTETIGAFSRRVSETLRRLDPDKVILDLRLCHGGDQSLGRALVLPLIRWDNAQRPGHLYALVGPETFSAAVNLASRLEEWTQVTFVGAPLGSGPSHYSSSDREVLDRSGLVARVSTGYFVGWTGSEWRETVDIALPVKTRIVDHLNGDDTVLAAALNHDPGNGLAEHIISAHQGGGINAGLIVWSRYRTDPATAHLGAEAAGNAYGRYLLNTGELSYAAGIFLFNREFHPNSIDAYLGEAEARFLMGDAEQALGILNEAAAKQPGDARIPALRARIRGG